MYLLQEKMLLICYKGTPDVVNWLAHTLFAALEQMHYRIVIRPYFCRCL